MANKLAYTMNEQELDSLMNDMDDNKDGKISLEEFIAATVSWSVVVVGHGCATIYK